MHNDYCLACEKVKVTEEMLSEYQLQTKKNNNFSFKKKKKNPEKLIPYLDNKRKYKLCYQNFKILFNFKVTIKKSS